MLKGNGTGITGVTGTAGGATYWSDANTIASTAAGTAGQVLTSGGSGAPTWGYPQLTVLTGTPEASGATTSATVYDSRIDSLVITTDGDYLITYTGTFTQNGDGRDVFVQIWKNNTAIANSERYCTARGGIRAVLLAIHQHTTGLVNGDKIVVRWKISAGIGTYQNGALTALRVK